MINNRQVMRQEMIDLCIHIAYQLIDTLLIIVKMRKKKKKTRLLSGIFEPESLTQFSTSVLIVRVH